MKSGRRLFALAAAIAASAVTSATSRSVDGPSARPAAVVLAQDSSVPVTAFRVGFLRGASYQVETVPAEGYVARVLAGEAARDSPPAALEALAVAIRTFAVANRGRHASSGFDLCDQTHCQVVRTASAATERAARQTAGQVLHFAGRPAAIFYSASCGGHTERPSAVWPGSVDPPYLPTQADDACEGQPAWTVELRAGDLQRALRTAGYRGTLRSLRVASRYESGRVASLVLEGLTPGQMTAQDMRMAVARVPSLPQIQSASFELRQGTVGFLFVGRGYGHGVGMCVIGSVRLASRGFDAPSILGRYFPGTSIVPSRPAVARLPAAE